MSPINVHVSRIPPVPYSLTPDEEKIILKWANLAKVTRWGSFGGAFQDGVLTDLSTTPREDRHILRRASEGG